MTFQNGWQAGLHPYPRADALWTPRTEGPGFVHASGFAGLCRFGIEIRGTAVWQEKVCVPLALSFCRTFSRQAPPAPAASTKQQPKPLIRKIL